jgi:uncharacterized protein (TIGR02145 family)
MKSKHFIPAAALVLALALTLIGCDGGKSALIGRWKLVDGSIKYKNMELLKDGTAIVGDESSSIAVNWKIENDRFYLTHPLGAQSWGYKISGSTLTLTDNDSKVSKYKTEKAIEEEAAAAVAAFNARLSKGTVLADPLKDSRDGKTYKTVKIDEQVWMAENLNYKVEGSKCGDIDNPKTKRINNKDYKNGYTEYTVYPLLDDNTKGCDKYGRLYNWETAMKACPKGWHLPSDKDWYALYRSIDTASSDGYSKTGGKHLKAKEGWNYSSNGKDYSVNAEDTFGFSALPGGIVIYNGSDIDGYLRSVGEHCVLWSSSNISVHEMGTHDGIVESDINYYKKYDKSPLFSIRCVKD